jgi:FeS assembly SUF system protein
MMNSFETMDLEAQMIEALRTCYDPEIPVNIHELGLIYETRVDPEGNAYVKMTLTSPNCPEAASLPATVEEKVKAIPGITSAKVELTFDPPWSTEMMSEAAKLQLNMF